MHEDSKGRAVFDRPGEFVGSLKAAYLATEIDPDRFPRTYEVWTELVGQMHLDYPSIPSRHVGELVHVVDFLTRYPSKVRQYYAAQFDFVTTPDGKLRVEETTEAIISDMRIARRGLASIEARPQPLRPSKQTQSKIRPTGRVSAP